MHWLLSTTEKLLINRNLQMNIKYYLSWYNDTINYLKNTFGKDNLSISFKTLLGYYNQ